MADSFLRKSSFLRVDTSISELSVLKEIGALVVTGEFGDGGKAATAKITNGKGMKAGDAIKPKEKEE